MSDVHVLFFSKMNEIRFVKMQGK